MKIPFDSYIKELMTLNSTRTKQRFLQSNNFIVGMTLWAALHSIR
ncbi:hypothetical protein GAGA_2299 [Paraglaciecola agarilytica NO2]|uniref:Transposase n=1 Tax=Paraglaciecola agarilytica NO2 TaxID=1125747 RepID=A0ABQ0I729_9ALTE|nr:hypothetical protein GAGA_2299 [Paraglaciecola agarilytica NO2]